MMCIFNQCCLEGDVGSIAGGGRYDELVGMFSKSGQKIPCVGMSIGVERVFTILEARAKKGQVEIKQNPVEVFVAAAGGDLLEERMKITNMLWNHGIKAEFTAKRKVKPLDQFSYCEKNFIPLIVLFGPEEIGKGFVKVRSTGDRAEEEVPVDQLVQVLQNKLSAFAVEDKLSSLKL